VPNIPKEDPDAIGSKTVELFNNIIKVMEKHKILGGLGVEIYNELHKLRKYRNKVHIQTDVRGHRSRRAAELGRAVPAGEPNRRALALNLPALAAARE
jgi:hypothetical protein